MFYCEECREKKNYPDSLTAPNKCDLCHRHRECYDVPAVMLVPKSERTFEQQKILDTVLEGFKLKAERIQITNLDGRVNNLLTDSVREMFVKRNGVIDWYITYQIRIAVQNNYLDSERTKRDRRQF